MLPITMMTERRKAGLWKRMKSMRVSAGTRWKGLYIVSASKRQQLRPEPAQPDRGHEPRHVDRGEERGDDADQQRDRETLDRARAELEQEQGGDDVRDVGIDDGGLGLAIAGFHGGRCQRADPGARARGDAPRPL